MRRLTLAATLALAAVVAAPAAGPALAGTPADTLVVAKNIDDIITLDPAEVFEFSGGEVASNLYDRVMMYEPDDLSTLVGGVAESYQISDDGKTIIFKIRPNQTFHSGNPVRGEDVAWSLQRVVKLSKTPSFILTQIGWDADNVDQLVTADGDTVTIKINAELSPGLVLNALSATVGSVVDKELVMSHEKDGDMGYEWLKTNSAGSGPFSLKSWKANELVMMEANPNYRSGAPKLKRVVIRHIKEPAAQRLLIEKGDADMVRNLQPDQIKGLAGNPDVVVNDYPKAALIYIALNQANPILSKPKVREAVRYLVDYKGMEDSFLAGQWKIHQSVWPSGLWASYDETPFHYDLDKAKALLAEAGYPNGGFKIAIDTLAESPYKEIAQSVQQSLSQLGIESDITLSEGKTLWPKYRARKHELIVAQWSPDYVDPHSNLDSFAHNPDNRLEAKLTGKLAWRNSWDDPEITAMTAAAATEVDLAKRKQEYLDLQKKVMEDGPYAVLFQQNEQVAMRKNVKGFVSGSTFDLVFYRNVTKE
jgi:peptide/nickel transport system substrate-binding protein